MKQIYIVTLGSYSDYNIEGVFSTMEKAQAYIDAYTGSYINEVEVYTIDYMTPQPGKSFYTLTMGEDGAVLAMKSGPIADSYDRDLTVLRPDWATRKYVLQVSRYSKSEAHVIKIANELRVQRIATLGWPEVVFVPYGQNATTNPCLDLDEAKP